MPWILITQADWDGLTGALRRVEAKVDNAIVRLKRIEAKDDSILTGEQNIMADLTQLTADVAANHDAVQSAVTLLQGLKAALDAAGTDPVALKALSDSLEASTADLAAAVAANTPVA